MILLIYSLLQDAKIRSAVMNGNIDGFYAVHDVYTDYDGCITLNDISMKGKFGNTNIIFSPDFYLKSYDDAINYLKDMVNEYIKRLSKYTKVEIIEIKEENDTHPNAKEIEGKKILDYIKLNPISFNSSAE